MSSSDISDIRQRLTVSYLKMIHRQKKDEAATYRELLQDGWGAGKATTTLVDLPPELLDRIASTVRDLGDYRSLLRMQRLNRQWFAIATPHIYAEVGNEYHHTAGLFDEFTWVRDSERHFLMKRWDKRGRDGHPIDWPHPTRLMWYCSLVKSIVYRPVHEDEERILDFETPELGNISEALEKLYDEKYPLRDVYWSPEVFPALKSLCIDTRDYKERRPKRPGHGLNGPGYEAGSDDDIQDDDHDDDWEDESESEDDDDGYYEDENEGDYYDEPPDFFSSLCQAPLLNTFLAHISQSIHPDFICISASGASLDGTMPMIEDFCAQTIVIHDFGGAWLDDGLPSCEDLIVDWHRAHRDARRRLLWLFPLLISNDGYVRPDGTSRILFPRSTLPTAAARKADDAAFRKGMDEMLKGKKYRDGLLSDLQWAFMDEADEPIGETCRGCRRKSPWITRPLYGIKWSDSDVPQVHLA